MPRKESVNGFALYQLQQRSALGGQLSTFFAFRESMLEQNSVETAIFWTASSLEEAVEALGNLPIKTIGETVKDKVFGYSNLFGTLMLGLAAGYLTNSAEVGLGAAALYLAGRTAYVLLRSYFHWQSALDVFGDHVEGRLALSKAIDTIKGY